MTTVELVMTLARPSGNTATTRRPAPYSGPVVERAGPLAPPQRRSPDTGPVRADRGQSRGPVDNARDEAGRRGAQPDPATREPDRPPAEAVAGNRLLTGLLFTAGLVTSVALWVFDGPFAGITDSASALIAAGRVTGLIAGYLLFIQLLMMSRVAWLEDWVGARDLLRWHRGLGVSLLTATLAHVVCTIYGYAAAARTSVTAQTATMLVDMASAFIATGIMVAMSLLAVRAIRRLLPYELWHLLHLAGYLVLLFGYGHQIGLGTNLGGPFASVFWPSLAALVVAAVLWGRVVEPLHLNLRHRLRVADVVAESDDSFSIYLTGRRLDRLPARAGQFLRWRFLSPGGWWQSHPFSLSAAPNPHWLRLTVTAVGRHTTGLRQLKVGTRVLAEGPFGTFTAQRRTRRRALLIAGGSGIAPIRALIEDMPADTVVIYRARTPGDLVFRDELDVLARQRDARVHYVLGGRDDPGPRRLLTPGGLQSLVPDVNRRDVYLCGPPGMVDAAMQALRDLEVPPSQLHLDPFEF